ITVTGTGGTLTGTVVVSSTVATAATPFVYYSSGRLYFYWANTSLPPGSYNVTVTNPITAGGLSVTLAGGFVVN
ncbi:MAG: hypothetical protein HY036_10405, partial [Nitrospirae bacterium]|nr:hypothetical protein [Nitrospirota bacterium]